MTNVLVADVQDYETLRNAVRARCEQLNISRAYLLEVAGLPRGHAGKLLARGTARDVKRFGMVSLGLVLLVTGLRMVLTEDQEPLAKFRPMFTQ